MPLQQPVLPGFHPDPSVCRVGDTYYLATSSFEYAPGVPLHRSTDLRCWQLVGHALSDPTRLDVRRAGPSGGIFAPTLRHHGGEFWLVTTNWADGGGQLLVRATDPAGPWSAPVRFPAVHGIDPDLAWDDAGGTLMSYAGTGPDGAPGILQVEVDPDRGEVLSAPRVLWRGTGGKYPEGPHLYRLGQTWYLLIAEGGTERGHAVTIARGDSPRGPFEPNVRNPVLTRRGIDHPVQNTGHADLVERPDGTWAMVYHGVRVRGTSPQWHVLGRETFADEVRWQDGWPQLDGHLEPVAAHDQPVTASLGEPPLLPADWVGAGRFPAAVMSCPDGVWTVTAPEAPDTPDTPALGPDAAGPVFVGRRQQHLACRVTARVTVDGCGGIAVRIDPWHALELEVGAGAVRAVWVIGGVRHVLGERPLPADAPVDAPLDLELSATPADPPGARPPLALGPDTLAAAVLDGGDRHLLGTVDGRYLSTEVTGGFTGRLVGVTCSAGSVRVESFRYTGCDDVRGLGLPSGGTQPQHVGGMPAAQVAP